MKNIFDMKSFKARSASDAYSQLVAFIEAEGEMVEARGKMTKEVLNVSCLIDDVRDRIIPISKFNEGFILQETFDILNENPPRVAHSKEMLETTMGNSSNIMFFGNELRQACSRWSIRRLINTLVEDKNTRKAVLDLSNRRPVVHTPCLLYAHFMIRDNKLFLNVETRGTAISMGFIHDIYFFTILQELVYTSLLYYYPELELGQFLYKTGSLHMYVDENCKPLWPTDFISYIDDTKMPAMTTKSLHDNIRELGSLYWSVDEYMKAHEYEDIDTGAITTWSDIERGSYCKTTFYKNWNKKLYEYHKRR